jgi:signal transduction histidine kinase
MTGTAIAARKRQRQHGLAAQMMLSLAALALLSTLVVGLPAIWLVRNQLQSQAWAQLQQGLQASQALYSAQQRELAGLATLTAERPSLAALLRQPQNSPETTADLLAYLDTLRAGADLDLIAVCSAGGDLMAQVDNAAGAALLPPLCTLPAGSTVLATRPEGAPPQVWLVAAQPLSLQDRSPARGGDAASGMVVTARWLDQGHMQEMRSQTGLEHTLLVDNLPVVSSLAGQPEPAQPGPAAGPQERGRFTWNSQPFYAARWTLAAPDGGPAIAVEGALAVARLAAAEQRLLRLLLGSMALAIVLGLGLAVVLARRISRPLADLAGAATAMRSGNLSSPIAFDTGVREVALLGQSLEVTRADLQSSLVELRQEKALTEHFLASVSHEFRTPLTAVAASVELLIDQAAELSPAELHELLNTLHLGVLNLHKLVDNLLESANIEAGRFRVHPRPANLGEIIADAAATMQPLLDRHGQRLVVELPAAIPVVMADPRRMVQVLVNLLSNASNAQRGLADTANGQITISAIAEGDAQRLPTSAQTVRVLVADQGPGIPADQKVELLRGRRFAVPSGAGRADDYPTGFGLGLSVVKAIVEGHGGHWGIDDRPGGGAVVWFTLPRA